MNNRKGCVIGTKLYNDKYNKGEKESKTTPYKKYAPGQAAAIHAAKAEEKK
tara:strand:- start:788 stop:940 length:153 start_codon:yes stop_codon:yes gene_type:complete